MEVEYSYGKICVVCSCSTPNPPKGERDSFRLYIIDLDESSGSDFLGPRVRIGWSYSLYANAFCVLNSTVYIFGTFSDSMGGLSVYTYELKPNDSYTRLSPSLLVQINDMHAFKFDPEAIPTPDRKKVVVFSSTILKSSKIVNPDKLCDFEVYDPVVGCWEKLTAFPNSWRKRDVDISIKAYTFVENENVLLLLTEDTMFSLDFRSEHQRWERTPRSPDSYYVRMSQYFLLVGKDLYISPSGVRDKEDWFQIPGLSEVGLCVMTLLDKNDGGYQFCTVQCQLDKSYEDVVRPRLTINVCNFNYNKYEEEKKKRELEKKKRKSESDHYNKYEEEKKKRELEKKKRKWELESEKKWEKKSESESEWEKKSESESESESEMEREMENPLPGTTVVKSFEFHLDEELDSGWLFGPIAVFPLGPNP